MRFYTLSYIQNHQATDKTVITSLMLVAAFALVIFAFLYLRDRLNSRYRDLGIIALLFLLLFSGTQYERYIQNNHIKSQAAQIVPFIKSVAKDNHVAKNDVLVNSTTLQDGLIVRINSRKEDYQLHLNNDNNSYTLTKAHVVNHHVYIER